jgi:hypothetical protein
MTLRRNLQHYRRAVVVAALCLGASLVAPRAEAAKALTSLRVVVTDQEGEPIPRASVVVSRLKSKEKPKVKGEPLQIKTSLQGAAPLPPLQQGVYMVQVISSGYQTSGEMIELNEPEQDHNVVMKPPQNQFSVHTDK